LWDLAEDPISIALIEQAIESGKPVATVCHAPGVLRHVKTSDGKPLVSGKSVTGFSNTEEEAEETVLPIGFKQVFYDSYLESRGFKECDYYKYPCGVVDINKKLKNFILFLVYENNVLFGYLGRNKMPKSEIDAINKEYKEQELNKRILRWNNSDADFSKLVYGIDNVTDETLCVIIVESIFGKKRIDDYLKKHKINEMKCVSTFGSKISEMQIRKIFEKGIRNVILMFDPDAVNKIKNYSFDLECCFDSVEIAVINDNEDIDNFTDDDIYQSIFVNVKNSFEYFSNKIQIKLK
jgi:hypothetical protein